MEQGGGGSDGLTLQLQAARAMTPDLEVQQLKASVRARLFGIVEAPPTLGDYTIVRLIGRGGMGAVYEARDVRGEVVALKMLRNCEAAALVRFKHEFRALSDLVHPNLALLYSLAVVGDQAFLTMEHIDGVDLLTHVHAAGPELGARLLDVLRQLVDGISALHAAGKLHRDVKPSNVLVTREGRVVILDFGLVQELAAPPGAEALAGTPAYMAPELIMGGAPTTASDWYSVGVMLYEALTGELPFVGSGLAVLRDKCERDPPPPSGAVDPGLARLCMQLLARDPQARPDRSAIVAAIRRPAEDELASGTGARGLSSGTGAPRPVAAVDLVGRQGELAALRQALAGVRPEQPAVVVLRGGSGVGKTALVDSFLSELHGRAVVLRGRCYEREQVPHNAFDGLVDALAGHLLTLSPAAQADALTGDIAALVRLFPGLSRLSGVPLADAAEAARGSGPHPAAARKSGPHAAASRISGPHTAASRISGPHAAASRISGPHTAARGGEPARKTGAQAGVRGGESDSRWRERAYSAFKGLIEWLAARGPVVLHIDDLQWADADSATLLTELVSAPAPSCLLLASYRATANGAAPVVQELLQRLRAGGVRVWELTVEPLTEAEAERLARALLGAGPASASAGAIARESAGVPLFVHELVHDVLGSISAGGGAWPARLEDLIAARVQRLPATARDVLEVLAVAARPLAQGLVLGLAGGGAGASRAALQTLGAARLVRIGRSERGEMVEVFHDRIRETVLAGLPAERERACHRRLAAAIEACPAEALGEPEILAHHLFAAGDPAGARQHMITAAGQAAASLAFARAAELSLAAIRLCAPDDLAGRQRLRVDAAEALLSAGNHGDAAACYLAAADEASAIEALRLRRRAAEVLLSAGAAPRGEALLQTLLRGLGRPMPRNRVARMTRATVASLWLRRYGLDFVARAEEQLSEEALLRVDALSAARLAVVNYDPPMARMHQLEHLRDCLELGEPRRIVHAIAGHASYVSHDGTPAAVEAGRLLDQARAIGERHGVADMRMVDICAGIAAYGVGAWRSALNYLQAALPDPDAPGSGASVVYGLLGVWALDCSFFLGDLQGMIGRRDRYLEVVRAAGDRASEGRIGVSMQVFALLAADDPTAALDELSATVQRWPRGGFVVERAHAFLAERAIDLYSGDGPRAWARCADRWPAYTDSYMYQGQHGRVMGEYWRGACALLAAAAAQGRTAERLRGFADEAERRILGEKAPWADPLALVLRAGAEAQRGRTRAAITTLAVAITGFDRAEMRLWAAAARWQSSRLAGDATGMAAHEQRMRACGVQVPARMAAALAPGFPG